MSKRLLSHIALFTANLIYGINYTVAKGIMPTYIKPFGFIVLRVVGALILFFGLHIFSSKEKVEKKDIPMLILCGFFGVALNQLMFFKGLNETTPINAAIIMTTNPILVLIASAIIIRERITGLKILGILLGLAGAASLILFKKQGANLSFSSNTIRGDIMVLINAASYGVYLVLAKPLMAKYNPLTVIKWVFFVGMFFVVPVGFSEVQQINWNSFSLHTWGALAFVIIGTTFFAYGLNIVGLKNLSPSTVSTYIYLQPVLASLVAIIAGSDTISFQKIISTILIFVGVYLVSVRPKKQAK